MHRSAFTAVRAAVDKFVPTDRPLVVVDVGSQQLTGHTYSHRSLFDEPRCRYIGVDVVAGNNVDVVLRKPYGLPFDDDSVDVIVSGQTFEHIPFFWATMMDFARVVRPSGLVILSAPSRGHVHHRPHFDGWRFYSAGFQALGDFVGLECLEATTDYPPSAPETRRWDYSRARSYWGDTIGVFQKSAAYDAAAIAPVRSELLAWANRQAGSPEQLSTRGVTAAPRTLLRRTLRHARRLGRAARARMRSQAV